MFSPTEGLIYDGSVATFLASDIAGPIGDATATVNWGDGSPVTAGTILPGDGEGVIVRASHVYQQNRPRLVTVTVAGAGGSSAVGQAVIPVQATTPTLQPRTITATRGGPLVDVVVASFNDVNAFESPQEFEARIEWLSGQTTVGRVVADGQGGFLVLGSFTYGDDAQAIQNVKVEVFETGVADPQPVISTAVIGGAIALNGRTIDLAVGEMFSGVIASSTEPVPATPGESLTAKVTWTAGGASESAAVSRDQAGRLVIAGSHTYTEPGIYPISIELFRGLNGQVPNEPTTRATSTAVVASTLGFTGRLDPLSDLGPSSTDNITSTTQPIFIGTAQPLAVVQLFARLRGLTGLVPIAETVARADGRWIATSRPLAPNIYEIVGVEQAPDVLSSGLTLLTTVVIDTIAPRVSDVTFDPRSRRVAVTYSDEISGLDPESLVRREHYTLIGPPLNRALPEVVIEPDLVTTSPDDPRVVILTLPRQIPLFRMPRNLRILSGGVQDLAGNALDGETHGRLPSGNGVPGGTFQVSLFAHLGRVSLSPVVSTGPDRAGVVGRLRRGPG